MQELTCFVISPLNPDGESSQGKQVYLLEDEHRGLVEFPSGCKEATTSALAFKLDFDEVYKSIIQEAIEKINLKYKNQQIQIKCERGGDLKVPGDIITQILPYICTAAITITDVTTNNPNVFLEYGIRLAVKDKLNIMICHEKAKKNYPLMSKACAA